MMNSKPEPKRADKQNSPVDALSKTIEALESRLDSLIAARSRKPEPVSEEPRQPVAEAPSVEFDPQRDPISQLRETQKRLDAYRDRGFVEQVDESPKAPVRQPLSARPARTPQTTADTPQPRPRTEARYTPRPRPETVKSAPRVSAAPARSATPSAGPDTAHDSDLREVASALIALRRELRSDISRDFSRQFGSLQNEIHELRDIASRDGIPDALRDDLIEITRGIQSMGDDGDVAAMRAEISTLRETLDGLAREETLRALDDRWAEICTMMSDMDTGALRQDLTGLTQRVDEVATAVFALPDAARSERIEAELTSLAGIVDRLASETIEPLTAVDFQTMATRLDEIANSVANAYDHEAVEAREQIMREHVDSRFAEFGDRLRGTEDRLADSLVQQLEGIASQIQSFADRDDLSPLLARLDALSAQVSELSPADGSEELREVMAHLQDMSARIDDLGQAINGQAAAVEEQTGAVADRFEAIVQRAESQFDPDRYRNDFNALYQQLDGIIERLDQPMQGGADIGELESQIATLTEILNLGLGDLERHSSGIAEIEPRLSAIEEHLAHSGVDIIEAATKAAEAAVASFVENGLAGFEGSDDELTVVAGLAEDLRALERATRQSDERNVRTFEMVQDTLMRIAERLESLDGVRSVPMVGESTRPATAKRSAVAAPVANESAAESEDEAPEWKIEVKGRPEGEASSPAYVARSPEPERIKPLHDDDEDFWYGSSMNKPASRGTADDGEASADVSDVPEAQAQPQTQAPRQRMVVDDVPSLDPVDTMEAGSPDEPLEPGYGAPDIENILRKVRGEPSGDDAVQPAGELRSESERASLIAAARRAAQAAAADDGDMSDEKPTRGAKGRKGGSGSSGGNGGRRRPVLIAIGAVLLALMSYPVVSKMMEGESEVAVTEPVSQDAEVQTAEVETANDMPGATAPMWAEAPAERDQTATASVAPAEPAPQAADIYDVASLSGSLPSALLDAAGSGDAKALFEIGNRYSEGQGIAQNDEKAAEWYMRAAEEGYAPAQYRLGNLYETGTGVSADLDEARRWYQQAADRGNASAMHNLAVLYASVGVDGEPDFGMAAEWFRAAADRGISDSQFNLAVLHARGSGVERDLVQSYKWFAIAANAGDADAAEKRDEVAAALEEGELQRAQADADSWLPIPLDRQANTVELPSEWQVSDNTASDAEVARAVADIQKLLNASGYDAGQPDGVIGDQTVRAIMQFQTASNLAPTGELDEAFVRALIQEARRA